MYNLGMKLLLNLCAKETNKIHFTFISITSSVSDVINEQDSYWTKQSLCASSK